MSLLAIGWPHSWQLAVYHFVFFISHCCEVLSPLAIDFKVQQIDPL